MMTRLLLVTATAALGLVTFGCSDDAYGVPDAPFNEDDCRVVRQIYNEMGLKDVPGHSEWQLNNPFTWTGVTLTKDSLGSGLRVTDIQLNVDVDGAYRVPECISDLDYLQSFTLSGRGISGELTEAITKPVGLREFHITNTSLTSIPDGLFRPGIESFEVTGNKGLDSELPSTLANLDKRYAFDSFLYVMSQNSYKGNVPDLRELLIDLRGNNLTGISHENTKARRVFFFLRDMDEKGVYRGYILAPVVEGNRISGIIPDEIRRDTVELVKLHFLIREQQEGYGYTNMPPIDEIKSMDLKYKLNHLSSYEHVFYVPGSFTYPNKPKD
ncbi:MAG: hypothetical protein NC043_01230 [Muribaculaceae bacterium]|nr:hypothetical protein [Muribaculaceae bacterium]